MPSKLFKNRRLPFAPWPSEGRGYRSESCRARHFKVLQTKVLCDAYILRKFQQLAEERVTGEAEE